MSIWGAYDGTPTSVERWDSLTECVAEAKSRPNWGDGDREFNGGTYPQVLKWTSEGWPEGARKATEKANRIANRVLNSQTALELRDEYTQDVTGGCYDVGGYLSGTPECWTRIEPQLTKRAISIVLNICASGGVSAETIERRGLAVASLVLALQAKGYPVTVDVSQVAWYDSGRGECYAKVCRVIDASTGSQLDVDRLVYAIAHPTMFRCVFRALSGEGWPASRPASDGYPPGDYDLKFGGAHLNQAERWVDGGEQWVMDEFIRQTST